MYAYLAWRLQSLRNRFRSSESGATLVEYALLVALIAVVCIVASVKALRVLTHPEIKSTFRRGRIL